MWRLGFLIGAGVVTASSPLPDVDSLRDRFNFGTVSWFPANNATFSGGRQFNQTFTMGVVDHSDIHARVEGYFKHDDGADRYDYTHTTHLDSDAMISVEVSNQGGYIATFSGTVQKFNSNYCFDYDTGTTSTAKKLVVGDASELKCIGQIVDWDQKVDADAKLRQVEVTFTNGVNGDGNPLWTGTYLYHYAIHIDGVRVMQFSLGKHNDGENLLWDTEEQWFINAVEDTVTYGYLGAENPPAGHQITFRAPVQKDKTTEPQQFYLTRGHNYQSDGGSERLFKVTMDKQANVIFTTL